ncbi:MAG TPA: sulfocyanin-like copper-binding protein [Gemmatimonadaceae bacterium]|jgi:sulfocyanin|nr:sulfocyanin-like copper-binding protein [Gemmatimonadaceae bacterium]
MSVIRTAALGVALMVGVAGSVMAQGSGNAQDAKGTAAGETKVNEFLSYDASAKRVTLQVDAALGNHNGGMNFNGGSGGNQTITIPVGWTVRMNFLNKDAIPHSAIIVPGTMPLPVIPTDAAIPGAYTKDLTSGIATDGTDTSTFRVNKPGEYFIECGVPGHGPSGMYIRFTVSATATAPSYTM